MEQSRNNNIDLQDFRREQVSMLYGQLPFILLADIVAGAFLFFILITLSASLWSYVWFALLISTSSLRAYLANQHSRTTFDPTDLNKRWYFLILGSLSAGVLWGTSWILLPDNPTFLQLAVVGLWLAGLEAGAASTMAVIKEVFIAFTLPASLIFIGFILLQIEENKLVLAGAYVMYLGFILPIAFRSNKEFSRSIHLQLNNSALQQNLVLEAARLEEKEAELSAQRKHSEALQSQKESADEQLQAAAEERLLLLDAVGEGIFGLNNRGNITFINSSALKMLNLQEADVLGQSSIKLISHAGSESATNVEAYVAISKCFKEGAAVESMISVLAGKDGKELPVRFSCKPIKKAGVVIGAVISFTDISKQREMEAMLLQSQKMEAIGRLTGGVSHDFNNLLTVIMGNLQFLQKRLTEDEKASALVKKIMSAARSGADLNTRLLSFAREQTLEINLVNVCDMLQEVEEFLDRLLGEDIALTIDLGDENNTVLTDRTQLENALLNLVVNAKDAMPNGGELSIVVKNVHLARSIVQSDESIGEGKYIEIAISDNGVGIPEAIQKQIFEPFFTTKEKDRGTGLGLSTVYGFIRQSGGNITVDSGAGEGTTFKLYLPQAETVAIRQPESLEPVTAPDHYEGTVLVVEDDDRVREIAASMLEEVGFEVITARDGRSGLAQFKRYPDIDLVFSDVIMPGGLSGIEMAEKILKIKPNIPILLATGYTEKSIKDHILGFTSVVFVSKPYDTKQLPKLIHSMMMERVS